MPARDRIALGLAVAVAAAIGCTHVGNAVKKTANVAAEAGVISGDASESVGKVSDSAVRSNEEFTDAEEHYIGRSVAANIFARVPPLEDEALNAYVSRVGAAVALASDRPETYAGYRFQVLASDEINAFAAPGGFIFVTKGLLDLCEDEDMLAGVLAHEIAHVCERHGLDAITSARRRQVFAVLGDEAGKALTQGQVTELSKALTDCVGEVSSTLFVNGYGRSAEKDADRLATLFAARAGYEASGLARALEAMERHAAVAKGGMFETHPDAKDRREVVQETIEDERIAAPAAPASARAGRFQAATRS